MPSAPLPAYTNPFREVTPVQQGNGSARRPSDSPALRIDTNTNPHDPLHVGIPATNAPGALSPIHAHNYPWSREPSSFSAPPDVEHSVKTLVNASSDTSSFPASPAQTTIHSHTKYNNHNNFETTSHNFNTTNYTSVSAGSSPKKDDRGPSPTRLLSPMSKRSTNDEGRMVQTHPSGRRRQRTDSPSGLGNGVRPQGNLFRRMSEGTRRFGLRLRHMDPVKLAYLRTSFVFAISILVTWTPSSINRVYTLIYPNKASYGLNIAAAVVLPLQGVWNAVIYFTTSWKIFREEVEATRVGQRLLKFLHLHSVDGGGGGGGGTGTRQSGSFALASVVRMPRSEMGRSRRLEGESRDRDGDREGVELQSPMSSPPMPPRRPQPVRTNTMRVTQKGLDDFT